MIPDSVPAVLSIAGSDSGGGAGIQADLKAFARCGAHGMTAITAITAQNTVGVDGVELVAPKSVFAQIAAVAEDIGSTRSRSGWSGTAEIVEGWSTALDLVYIEQAPVVIDPVMVAESGAVLLDDEARAALVGRLLPLADGGDAEHPRGTGSDRGRGGGEPGGAGPRRLSSSARKAVVVTGGHSEELVDLFFDGERLVEIHGERHPDGAAHGSGCTHSSALAAFLAHGDDPLDAARKARTVASGAVAAGLREIGSGPGPVDALGSGAERRTSHLR